MRRLEPWQIAAGVIAALVIALVAWRLLTKGNAEAEPPPPSALVTIGAPRLETVDDTVTAYGVVAGSAAASRTVAAPRAVVVEAVLVGPGQPVAAGAPLVVVGDTPASALAWRQTIDAQTYAEQDLARMQRLYAQHLADSDQLATAQKTLADAKAASVAQKTAGAGPGRQTIAAPFAGVIGSAPVVVGEHVAADAPLVTLVARGGFVAMLGVEPSRSRQLAPGQPALVSSALGAPAVVHSKVAIVGQAVDPTTGLISVAVPVAGADLSLGSAVQGQITVSRHNALLVPRAAIVYDERGAHLFVVRAGKARETAVRAGTAHGDEVEVTGPVAAGDPVAVEGAFQLEDGMPVRIARP